MLIGITGDTHGNLKVLETIASKDLPVEEWFHTGDFYEDAFYLAKLTKLKVQAVAGNNDFLSGKDKANKFLHREGCKIWLTHGHKHPYDLLVQAQNNHFDIVVSGHTHVPNICWQQNILFLNPGSPAYPRKNSRPGFLLLTLEQKQKPKAEWQAL